MADWIMKITDRNGDTRTEEFDHDEIGTMDDMLTGFFILSLEEIDSITLSRQLPGWGNNG